MAWVGIGEPDRGQGRGHQILLQRVVGRHERCEERDGHEQDDEAAAEQELRVAQARDGGATTATGRLVGLDPCRC